jgi:hypothetical protein
MTTARIWAFSRISASLITRILLKSDESSETESLLLSNSLHTPARKRMKHGRLYLARNWRAQLWTGTMTSKRRSLLTGTPLRQSLSTPFLSKKIANKQESSKSSKRSPNYVKTRNKTVFEYLRRSDSLFNKSTIANKKNLALQLVQGL